MAVPSSVLAVGWIPFTVVLLLILFFSFIYIRYFQSKYDSELSSTIVSIFALAVALFTSALVPVDIFLVSFMKNRNGTFKPWANISEDRDSMEDTVLYAYYSLYILVMVFMFFILPFVYFYYEEKDDDQPQKARCCSAFKFTIGFVIFAAVLLIVGAFAPMKTKIPDANSTSDWDRIAFLFKELGENNGEDAVSFAISCLTLVGFLTLIFYTAYGMSAWPLGLILGNRSAKSERLEVTDSRSQNQSRLQTLKDKYFGGRRRMSAQDRREVDRLEEEEAVMGRRERHLVAAEKSCLNKCFILCRPFQVLFGIVFILIAALIFVSLLLTNIDKAMHSLGPKLGYALPKRSLPNPIDITLVFAQQVFPLDYILMIGIIMYFFFCSMSGIQNMGVWFLWIRMFKIRVRRTVPQGLLFMCMIMMFITLAINIIIYQIAPQYSVYGSQHYMLKPCDTLAPPDECIMTRMTMILTTYFYKVWFFGACYYWGSWAFLGVFLIGIPVGLCKKRSAIDGQVEDDDIDDSDDDQLLRA
ncbi:probable lysosomal cobalamin transporter [Lineus longissimus]|uniref:probable lysosomal cobalamin transporter n=1 Tax=Lineus longissimus TaxID=88925 RepID=UPI00315C5A1B